MGQDIIAAIATAWGEAAISIVKLSGRGSRDLVDSIFRGKRPLKSYPPRFMCHGYIINQEGEAIDEVLAVWFQAPYSYTGEEVAEIHCHGGTLVARLCLEELLKRGARLAEPGEFTRRAFVNGRIDLSQAESVIGIIRARSEEALKSATRNLVGSFSEKIKHLYDEIMEFCVLLEANLDFPEEDIPPLSAKDGILKLTELRNETASILDSARKGNLLREGIRVALVGRPNVGKSSLLNAFLNESRAIVTAIPGTTRDIIEEVLTHKGVPLRLVDTAGIREPSDEVEAIGVEKAQKALHESDILLWVIDGNERLQQEDLKVAYALKNKRHIVVINKADLPLVVTEKDIPKILPESKVHIISANNRTGIEELKDSIVDLFLQGGDVNEGLNATTRQIEELKGVLTNIDTALEALSTNLGEDAAAACLAEARKCLERILGVEADEALLDAIFSSFCIGK